MTQFQDMMRRSRLAAEDDDWAPEPGNHDAVVVGGEAFESKAGDPTAKIRLELRTPNHPQAGRHWDHILSWKDENNQKRAAGALSIYGLSDDEIDGLEDVDALGRAVAELVGTEVEVTCRAKDGGGVWTNVQNARSNRALMPEVPADTVGLGDKVGAQAFAEQEAARGAGDSRPAPDDDDIPF